MYEDIFDDSPEYKTPSPSKDRPFLAIINTNAFADGDDVYVRIPAIDGGETQWGPVRWSPRPSDSGPLFPSKNDEALVQYDDAHNMWMYLWWPYA